MAIRKLTKGNKVISSFDEDAVEDIPLNTDEAISEAVEESIVAEVDEEEISLEEGYDFSECRKPKTSLKREKGVQGAVTLVFCKSGKRIEFPVSTQEFLGITDSVFISCNDIKNEVILSATQFDETFVELPLKKNGSRRVYYGADTVLDIAETLDISLEDSKCITIRLYEKRSVYDENIIVLEGEK